MSEEMDILKRVIIKEEFVKLTGDIKMAIILNQFIYWSERVKDFDKFIAEEKSRAELSGSSVTIESTNGWIYKTAEELAEETMLCSSSTVSRHVKSLVEKGWLEERNNPLHRWDRTKQYRVNLVKIHEDLLEIGYYLQDYKVKFPSPKTKNASTNMGNASPKMGNGSPNMENRTQQNGGTIPEITTSNTIIQSSIHHEEKDRACAKDKRQSVDSVDKGVNDFVEIKSAKTPIKSVLMAAGFEGLPMEVEYMSKWVGVFPPEMIEHGVKKAVLNGIKSLPYVAGIFEDWVKKGVRTIEQAERESRYDSILVKPPERGNTRGRKRGIALPDPQLFRDYQNHYSGSEST